MASTPWIEDPALLPEWLDGPSLDALRAPDEQPPAALIAAGRLLRGGHLPGGARKSLEAGLRALDLTHAEAALRAKVDALSDGLEAGLVALDGGNDPAGVVAVLARRDDLESLSWALGLTGREGLERELLRRCHALDGRASARRDRMAAALRHDPEVPAWLLAIARHTPGAWWANLLLAGEHREEIERFLTRPLVGSALQALGLSPRALEQLSSLQFGGEAASEPEAILARPLGAPVASLFDGEVLVHTHGLAEHDDETPPGLVVRHAGGDFDAILEVRLEPQAPGLPHRSPLALAWWVPLAGAGAGSRALRVSLADPEGGEPRREALAITPLAGDDPQE
ncbi:MAG: hypothetical protein P1V51_02270 [Deltaproteobacteria bacterium]|nr:hypothetical protein [Deltaproteobacteria bacterium]